MITEGVKTNEVSLNIPGNCQGECPDHRKVKEHPDTGQPSLF